MRLQQRSLCTSAVQALTRPATSRRLITLYQHLHTALHPRPAAAGAPSRQAAQVQYLRTEHEAVLGWVSPLLTFPAVAPPAEHSSLPDHVVLRAVPRHRAFASSFGCRQCGQVYQQVRRRQGERAIPLERSVVLRRRSRRRLARYIVLDDCVAVDSHRTSPKRSRHTRCVRRAVARSDFNWYAQPSAPEVSTAPRCLVLPNCALFADSATSRASRERQSVQSRRRKSRPLRRRVAASDAPSPSHFPRRRAKRAVVPEVCNNGA